MDRSERGHHIQGLDDTRNNERMCILRVLDPMHVGPVRCLLKCRLEVSPVNFLKFCLFISLLLLLLMLPALMASITGL
jgi:hypothetical protein